MRILGHRGGRGEGWPAENTIAAFERALAEGAGGVELDVRLSADGIVVVVHDAELGDGRRVSGVSAAMLGRLGVPTLDEALEWAQDRAMVNVEVKRARVGRGIALARAVAASVRRVRAEIVVSSFDPSLVLAMAALAPAVPRAFLTNPRGAPFVPPLPIQAVHLERAQATEPAVRRYKSKWKVGVWTVNDPDEAARLADVGVDWLITDSPARIRAGLGEARR
jgi:glycerophosphoryl diester phosphodiesterase